MTVRSGFQLSLPSENHCILQRVLVLLYSKSPFYRNFQSSASSKQVFFIKVQLGEAMRVAILTSEMVTCFDGRSKDRFVSHIT